MLIHFPCMHPELIPAELTDKAVFLDPGFGDEGNADFYFRPDSLPLDAARGRALIEDCMRFGAQFKDSSEMAFFGAFTPEDYYEESTSTIKHELMTRLSGETKEEGGAEIANAQFTLMLAWHLEEGLMESRGLEQGIRDSWKKFDNSLGMDEAEAATEGMALGKVLGETASPAVMTTLPWQRVMEAMSAFVPDAAVLLNLDAGARAVWEELGIEFVSPAGDSDLPENILTASAPAWKFAGRKRQPEKLPWTSRKVTVGIFE